MKILFLFLSISIVSFSQNNDSTFIRNIYNKALSEGKSYEDLRELCKKIGARLSGSAEAEMARRDRVALVRLQAAGSAVPRAIGGEVEDSTILHPYLAYHVDQRRRQAQGSLPLHTPSDPLPSLLLRAHCAASRRS